MIDRNRKSIIYFEKYIFGGNIPNKIFIPNKLIDDLATNGFDFFLVGGGGYLNFNLRYVTNPKPLKYNLLPR